MTIGEGAIGERTTDARQPPGGHHVVGWIHELLPLDGSPQSLTDLLRHECDHCDGARVLIDLTEHPGIDGRHVDVILETITPEDERWSISVPSTTDPEILVRLREAGHHVIERHDGA